MRWNKVGQVFCADRNHSWMMSHASVPTAEWLRGDVFRVYFSCRDARQRSSVGFVDIDLARPQKILNLSNEPVLAPGPLGAFDEDGAMLSWITCEGTRRYYYYIGWNLGRSVPFRNSIGVALGQGHDRPDKCFPGPIVDRGPYDPCFVASSCVLHHRELWRMWYLSCIGWSAGENGPRHSYHIKYATSKDGLHWDRCGRVCIAFRDASEYAISRPSVVIDKDCFRMWYSYRGAAYRIGYAESRDGIEWTRKDDQVGIDVSPSAWDADMIEYPYVFDHGGARYMLYNGNDYGRTGFGLAILAHE